MTSVSASRQGALRPASRTELLSTEAAFEVVARVRALEAAGRNVVNLSIGEPDFRTPEHIVEAGVRSLRAGETRYSAPAGLPELRAAIAAELASRGIAATTDGVVVTPGAKPALFYALLALVEPGDEVLVPNPGFPIYPSVVRFTGGVPVSYGLDSLARFRPDVDEIAERITPNTRAIILNAPHNPTGGSVDAATLERIAELAEWHDLAVISDEVYGRLSYAADGRSPSIAAVPGLSERTVVVDGFSKTYAMTGWRLGYAVLPAALARRVETIAINAHSCTPVFVQRAGIAALTGPDEPVRALVAELRQRRDVLVRGLNEIPGVRCTEPDGAFYAYPDLTEILAPAGLTAAGIAGRLLEIHGLATLAGTAFGSRGEGHLRLSFAVPLAGITTALERLRSCVRSLALQ